MSNPFTKFFGFVLHIKSKVSDFFIHIFGAQTASEIGHAALSALNNTAIGKIVLEYVTEFTGPQYMNLANDVKRLQVLSKVEAWAKQHGLPFSEAVVNLLIEFSIGKIKGYYDAAGPHDSNNPPVEPPATVPTDAAGKVPPAAK